MRRMLFYRVSFRYDAGSSAGFGWYNSRADAADAVREHNRDHAIADWATLEEVWITPTRRGIMEALKRFATHADNG
jgi:hypothetical protein